MLKRHPRIIALILGLVLGFVLGVATENEVRRRQIKAWNWSRTL